MKNNIIKVLYEFNSMLLGDVEMKRLQLNNDNFWIRIDEIRGAHPQTPFLMRGFLQKDLAGCIVLLFEFDCKEKKVLVKLYDALEKLYQHPPVHIPLELLPDFPVRE